MSSIKKGHMVTGLQEGAEPIIVFIEGDEAKAQEYINHSMQMDEFSKEKWEYSISNEISFDPNIKHPNRFVNVD